MKIAILDDYQDVVRGLDCFATLSEHEVTVAVDVFENEPADVSNEPLLSMPNVLAVPHLGYVEKGGYELYFSIAFDNVVAFAEGRPENIIAS